MNFKFLLIDKYLFLILDRRVLFNLLREICIGKLIENLFIICFWIVRLGNGLKLIVKVFLYI